MSDPSSDQDHLRALWQAQPQETDPMTLEHIQAISRRLDRNEQRRTFVMFVVVALACFVAGVSWQKTPDPMVRMSFALYALGIMGCFISFFWMMRLPRDPAEPGGFFLRRRLERNLRQSGGRGLLILLPLAPWLISVVAVGFLKHRNAPAPVHLTAAQMALNFLPLVMLAAVWLVTLLIIRPRVLRRLRKDIADLDAAMK